ncbi:Ribosomal RNA large subunit methyltransferase F [Babesia sp. Xinjiang]|uniref:Ribosomal RNA large subunit methyltransferase F n=1 Tax=Babesia sp. Xinjiang TaxID=462227 RepID=UPI000A23FE48|nr:Ribosomal RNA large subunit methyltransferase F [Babesia sp. Xinjiang]ORM40165.1 Ribosomal RNA large subunit methyltransferase F [Babesia sp. Xinjiang]
MSETSSKPDGKEPMAKRGRKESGMSTEQEFLQQATRRSESRGRQSMHPRSKHNNRDDFLALARVYPVLKRHMVPNPKWKSPMPKHLMYHYDFTHPDAVYHLSKAILSSVYSIDFYLPCGCPNSSCDPYLQTECGDEECDSSARDSDTFEIQRYLAPCVPGRANYIHYVADLLHLAYNFPDPPPDGLETIKPDATTLKRESILRGEQIKVLDIGTGANCIYPLLGVAEYGWSFIASDIDAEALNFAKHNLQLNSMLGLVELRHQKESLRMFKGVLMPHEFVHLTICNPPFHASIEQANMNPRVNTSGTLNELVFRHDDITTFSIDGTDAQNLLKSKFAVTGQVNYTFSADPAEQGELAFIEIMLVESRFCVHNVLWFTSLVARLSTLKRIKSHIQSDMRQYHASNTNQIAYLDARVDDLVKRHGDSVVIDDDVRVEVSQLHACEFRTFTLNQGKQTRWVIAWTYFNAAQRYKVLKKLYN